jgi:hypothetical protein
MEVFFSPLVVKARLGFDVSLSLYVSCIAAAQVAFSPFPDQARSTGWICCFWLWVHYGYWNYKDEIPFDGMTGMS